jgi:hypothetical protein
MEQNKLRNSSGSFAILTAIRRASPLCAAPAVAHFCYRGGGDDDELSDFRPVA